MTRFLFASILFLFVFCSASAQQLRSVTIGVDGLHCSACTFSVEKSLMRLDFVEYVQMDLNARIGEVFLKKEEAIDLSKLAKAVTDAGFSVRDFYLNLRQAVQLENNCLQVKSHQLCLTNSDKVKNGQKIQLLGKTFLSRSTYKKWKKNQPEWFCSTCTQEEDHSFFATVVGE